MKNTERASISLKKVICISIVILFLMGIGVMATNKKINNVKIILSNGYEMSVLTSKINVSEILAEKHIVLLDDEKTIPEEKSEIPSNKTIRIVKTENNKDEVKAKEEKVYTTEELLQKYDSIIEKIVKEQVTIPFETITKDVSSGTGTKQDSVVQEGEDGIKEITYKVKYVNDVEVEKNEISSEIIKEPVNKIIEVRTKQVVTTRSTDARETSTVATSNPAQNSGSSLAQSVQGITPRVATLNASAYTASTCDKSPSDPGYGITASGARATGWYTVAAGSGYSLGTVIYIPYFSNMPNGGWFVVQDRGGAISNNRIDVYMDTYDECISFGRRNLECYIYE